MPRRMGLGVSPTASFMDMVNTPPEPCVFRQQVLTRYSASVTRRGRWNPSGQCEPAGLTGAQSDSAISSKFTTSNPTSRARSRVPLVSSTDTVPRGPLDSPSVTLRASRSFSS